MKLLDWYIFKNYIGTFLYAVGIMAVISCVIDYSEKAGDLMTAHAPGSAILFYYLTFTPHIVALLFHIFIFISTVFFTSRMAYRSELVAMLASGMSFNRLLRPYLYGALVLTGVSLAANHYLIPIANKYKLSFLDLYWHNKVTKSDENVHLQLSKNLFVYVQSYDYAGNSGYHFTAETVDGIDLKERITAESISYDSVKKIWTLHHVSIRTLDGMKEDLHYQESLIRQYAFVPKDLRVNTETKEAMTTAQLSAYINEQKVRGNSNLKVYQDEKYRRTAEPFAAIILTIIALCIAGRKVRGGIGLHLAMGIVFAVVYVFFMKTSDTFSINSNLNPVFAMWIPNIIFSFIAFFFYRRQVS